MYLLINTFGTRIRSTGERIVLALPGGAKEVRERRRLVGNADERVGVAHEERPDDREQQEEAEQQRAEERLAIAAHGQD